MKRLNTNQVLQLVLIIALIVNAVIHFTSPSYRYYRENFDQVKKGVVDFERKVKTDFVPAILTLATNRNFIVVSNSVSVSDTVKISAPLLSDTNSVSRLMSLDFRWFQGPRGYGFDLDGFHYHVGDVLFGSVIRSISPTMVVTDDYQFIKPILGKFTLNNSVSVSPRPSYSVPSNSVPSIVVPMLPDVYGVDPSWEGGY